MLQPSYDFKFKKLKIIILRYTSPSLKYIICFFKKKKRQLKPSNGTVIVHIDVCNLTKHMQVRFSHFSQVEIDILGIDLFCDQITDDQIVLRLK